MKTVLKIAAAALLVTSAAACSHPEPTPGVNTGKGYWAMENGKPVWKEYHSSRPGGSTAMHSTYNMSLPDDDS